MSFEKRHRNSTPTLAALGFTQKVCINYIFIPPRSGSAEAQSKLRPAQWQRPINQGGNLIKTYNVNTSAELSPINVEVRGSSEGWHPGTLAATLDTSIIGLCISGDGVMGCLGPAPLPVLVMCCPECWERGAAFCKQS